jgi:hypothetical protein
MGTFNRIRSSSRLLIWRSLESSISMYRSVTPISAANAVLPPAALM